MIGSNGAGKSTLLNAIAGQFLVGPGEIMLDGEDIGREPLHKRARLIARVFQDPMTGTAPGMSVEENLLLAELRPGRRHLRFGLSTARRTRWRERLSLLGLDLEIASAIASRPCRAASVRRCRSSWRCSPLRSFCCSTSIWRRSIP